MTPPAFEDEEGYDGPARLAGQSDSDAVIGPTPVEVHLRGHFEPIDGHFHWWGRIQPDEAVTAAYRPGATVSLTTPHGTVEGKLSDVDPWGRFRITGTGQPPFPV